MTDTSGDLIDPATGRSLTTDRLLSALMTWTMMAPVIRVLFDARQLNKVYLEILAHRIQATYKPQNYGPRPDPLQGGKMVPTGVYGVPITPLTAEEVAGLAHLFLNLAVVRGVIAQCMVQLPADGRPRTYEEVLASLEKLHKDLDAEWGFTNARKGLKEARDTFDRSGLIIPS